MIVIFKQLGNLLSLTYFQVFQHSRCWRKDHDNGGLWHSKLHRHSRRAGHSLQTADIRRQDERTACLLWQLCPQRCGLRRWRVIWWFFKSNTYFTSNIPTAIIVTRIWSRRIQFKLYRNIPSFLKECSFRFTYPWFLLSRCFPKLTNTQLCSVTGCVSRSVG